MVEPLKSTIGQLLTWLINLKPHQDVSTDSKEPRAECNSQYIIMFLIAKFTGAKGGSDAQELSLEKMRL